MKKRAFFNRLVFDFIYLDGIERSLCDLGLLQNSQPKIMHKKPAGKRSVWASFCDRFWLLAAAFSVQVTIAFSFCNAPNLAGAKPLYACKRTIHNLQEL